MVSNNARVPVVICFRSFVAVAYARFLIDDLLFAKRCSTLSAWEASSIDSECVHIFLLAKDIIYYGYMG